MIGNIPTMNSIKRGIKIKLGQLDRCEYELTPEEHKSFGIDEYLELKRYYLSINIRLDFEHTFKEDLIGTKLFLQKFNEIDSNLVSKERELD
jgi:hypothetical protein